MATRWEKGKASEEAVENKGSWIQTTRLITAKSDVSGGMSESELGDLSHGEARRREKRSGGKSFTWVRDRRASV